MRTPRYSMVCRKGRCFFDGEYASSFGIVSNSTTHAYIGNNFALIYKGCVSLAGSAIVRVSGVEVSAIRVSRVEVSAIRVSRV